MTAVAEELVASAAEITLFRALYTIVANAAQPMFPLRAGAVVEMPWAWSRNVTHVHAMTDVWRDTQYIAHHRLPFLAMGTDAAAVNQASDDMGYFVGNDLVEKFPGILQQ